MIEKLAENLVNLKKQLCNWIILEIAKFKN